MSPDPKTETGKSAMETLQVSEHEGWTGQRMTAPPSKDGVFRSTGTHWEEIRSTSDPDAEGFIDAAEAQPPDTAMSPDPLSELRKLSRAASSGPWSLGRRSQEANEYPEPWAPQVWPRSGAPVATLNGRIGAPHKDAADAAFIVAAVNYVRALLNVEV